MRLFIAIDMDNPDYFSPMQAMLRKVEGARMTFPSSYHITLKFLGEVDETTKKRVEDALSTIRFKRFDLRCDHIGVFPSEKEIRKEIRVVWVGFAGMTGSGSDPAFEPGYKSGLELCKKVNLALKTIGFRTEKDFVLHVTLSRVKSASPTGKMDLIKKIENMKIQPKTFEVNGFSLIKSTPTPSGPVYETVQTFKAA